MDSSDRQQIPAEVLAWAKANIDEKLIAEQLRDIEVNGGKELREFIHELEAIVDA